MFPGCYYDVGRCLKRSCRSTGSEEYCSDDNVCCEVTETVYPDCALGKNVTKVSRCSCSCPTPSVLIVRGAVQDSDSGLPLTGITVTIVGTTSNTTTDVNGDYSLNTIPSLRRRLVAKASDSAGKYLDNYVVKSIPGSESFYQVLMDIAMIWKAPFVGIDSVIENKLSISGDPSKPNNSSAYLKVPANAFYNIDGTQYTKHVSVSLTYIGPSGRLENAPGQFVTLNQNGQPDILVTLGVFSIDFVSDSGNQLLLNDNIDVFAKGPTSYFLWELEEQTGTWVPIRSLPRRRTRQETRDRLIGTFVPQLGRWYNLDFILTEGPCFFKVRVFQGKFLEENEVTSSVDIFPEVRQILAISSINAVRYPQEVSLSGCFTIRCPSELARISISVPPSFRYVERFRSIRTPLRPATIEDYISSIKIIFQLSQYNYTLSSKRPNMLYVNTQMAEIGPFYPDIKSCEASTFQDPAFWFAEPPVFVESNFYDTSEERCVGKFRIYIRSVRMLEVYDKLANFEIDALSVWSDNKYSVKVASAKRIPPPYISQNSSIIYPPQDGSDFHIYALSCVEYRCSAENDKTTVYFSFAKVPFLNCYKDTFSPPILNSSKVQEDYFLNRMSNAEEAIGRCQNDTTWDSHGGAGLLRCYDPKWFNG